MLEEVRTRGLGGAEEGASCWRGGKKTGLGGGNQNACAFAGSDIVMLKSQKLMGGKRFIC